MKKRHVVILVCLVIYCIAMYYLIGKKNIEREKHHATLLIGNSAVWQYRNQKWININHYSDIQKLNWEKFKVYFKAEKPKIYYVWLDDRWYFFNEKKEALQLDADFIGVNSNYDMHVIFPDETKITDFTYVNKVLEENGINEEDFTMKRTFSFDIDHDNKEENFYIISNTFTETSAEKIFSIVFMEKDSIIYPIYTDIDQNRGFNGCSPFVNAMLDIEDDQTYELILSCAGYSMDKVQTMLYQYKNEAFRVIISN